MGKRGISLRIALGGNGSCLKDARATYRKEIDPIRDQEVAVHEVQRKLRESLKNQEDIKRAAEMMPMNNGVLDA